MQDPFAAQDEAAVYVSRPASESALGKMELALAEGAGLVALLGPPGIGKSILLRVLAKRLERSSCCVFPDAEAITAEDLFVWIVRELDARDTLEAESALGNRSALLKFREWMLREWRETDTTNSEEALRLRAKDLAASGFPLVALIDHAETLGPETVRRLSALAKSSEQALSFVLALTAEAAVGLPWLTAIMPPITCVDYSEPLSLAETGAYVPERLRRSGAPAHLLACIDEARIRRIYSYSQGIPRRIHGELSLLHIELTRVRAGWGPAQTGGWGDSSETAAAPAAAPAASAPALAPAEPEWKPRRNTPRTELAPAPAPVADNAEQELERVLRPDPEQKAEEADDASAPILIQGDDASDRPLSRAVRSDWKNLSERSVPLSELAQRLDSKARAAVGASSPALDEASAADQDEPAAQAPAAQPPERRDMIESTDWGVAQAPRGTSRALRWTASIGVVLGATAAIGLAAILVSATSSELPDVQSAPPAAALANAAAKPAPSAAKPSAPAAQTPRTAATAPIARSGGEPAQDRRPELGSITSTRELQRRAAPPEIPAQLGASAPAMQAQPPAARPAPAAQGTALQPALQPQGQRAAAPQPPAAPAASSASTSAAAAAPAAGPAAASKPVQTYRVNINAIPYATIEIDNEVAGETPLGEYPVSAGTHVFRARMPNGETKERTLEITQDGMRIIFP